MNYLKIAVLALLIGGCAGLADKPNAARAGGALTIETLSNQVDRAEKNDWISQDAEDKLQDKLYTAAGLLGKGRYGVYTKHCTGVDNIDSCLDGLLREVERALREAKAGEAQ